MSSATPAAIASITSVKDVCAIESAWISSSVCTVESGRFGLTDHTALFELAQKPRCSHPAGPHGIGHRAPSVALVQNREIDDWCRRLVQPIVALVADHAHDLAPGPLAIATAQTPAERLRGFFPVLPGEVFGDDDEEAFFVDFRPRDRSARHHPVAHRLEVSGPKLLRRRPGVGAPSGSGRPSIIT